MLDHSAGLTAVDLSYPAGCSIRLRAEGKPYPRTCRVHGLQRCTPDLAPGEVVYDDTPPNGLNEPETPVQTAAAPARASHAVVTSYGLSVAYGPYPTAYAEQLADDLSRGSWKGDDWHAVDIGRLPGEPPVVEVSTPSEVADAKAQLFAVLEERQPAPWVCAGCGSTNPGQCADDCPKRSRG